MSDVQHSPQLAPTATHDADPIDPGHRADAGAPASIEQGQAVEEHWPQWQQHEPVPKGLVLGQRYCIIDSIHRGSAANIYDAKQLVLDRPIAVKVLHQHLCRKPGSAERFLREARVTSAIASAHVVDIIDFGPAPGASVFIAMERLFGEDLDRRLAREGRFSWPRTQNIMLQVVRALRAAHELGIIHRDLQLAHCHVSERPGQREFIKVLDFGVAKIDQDDATPLTAAGTIFGTARYMAPEQASGQAVDARCDIYAVGVMLYELLTGHAPFEDENPMKLLTRVLEQVPRPPSQCCPQAQIAEQVDRLVLRALAKDPRDRFQSMGELESELESLSLDASFLPERAHSICPEAIFAGPEARSSELESPAHDPAPAPAGNSHVDALPIEVSSQARRTRANNKWLVAGSLLAASVILSATSRVSNTDQSSSPPATTAARSSLLSTPGVAHEGLELADARETADADLEIHATSDVTPTRGRSPRKARVKTTNDAGLRARRGRRSDTHEQSIARLRRRAAACGDTQTVKVRFGVTPRGHVMTASALPPHENTPEGRCVVKLLKSVTFPKSQSHALAFHIESFDLALPAAKGSPDPKTVPSEPKANPAAPEADTPASDHAMGTAPDQPAPAGPPARGPRAPHA